MRLAELARSLGVLINFLEQCQTEAEKFDPRIRAEREARLSHKIAQLIVVVHLVAHVVKCVFLFFFSEGSVGDAAEFLATDLWGYQERENKKREEKDQL